MLALKLWYTIYDNHFYFYNIDYLNGCFLILNSMRFYNFDIFYFLNTPGSPNKPGWIPGPPLSISLITFPNLDVSRAQVRM